MTNSKSRATAAAYGLNGQSPEVNPFAGPQEQPADPQKRIEKWAARRYPVSALESLSYKWAWVEANRIARFNAQRDPVKDMPELYFKGDRVASKATDEELARLGPELTMDQFEQLNLRAAAIRENCRAQVKSMARSMGTPRPPLSEVIRLAKDMVNDPPAASIMDGLLYEETVTSWVGDGGTFKTFTVLALACSVASGRHFTPRLRVPQKRPVLFLCAERRRFGLIGDIRAWCQLHNSDIDSLEVHAWDDVVQLGDDEWMAELTDYVVQHGIKLVVFDTQRKATRGLEENSSTDMGAALANAQKLAKAAKAAVVVIHHTSRGADHARGSTVMPQTGSAAVSAGACVDGVS